MKTQRLFLFFTLMGMALTTQAQNALRYVTNNGVVTVSGPVESRSAITNVGIPDTVGVYPVVNIAVNSFFACPNLTNIVIGNNVTNIGGEAFSGCINLTRVMIGNSMRSIGTGAFFSCVSLTNIAVAVANPALSTINGVLFDKSQTFLILFPGGLGGSYTIPNSVTVIGNNAFYYCTNLTSIVFPGNAPSLGSSALSGVSGIVYYYYGTSGWGTTYGGLPTVMLGAPAPQIGGSGSVGVQSNKFNFTITGVANQTIVVEASTNLVNWLPIWTNRLSGTSTNFTDSQTTNYTRRFYQVQSW